MKPRTFDKKRGVWEAAKAGNPVAQRLMEQLDRGESTANRAHRELVITEKVAQRDREDQERTAGLPGFEGRYELICSDIRQLDLPPDSVDAIITDPPYGAESLPLYGSLAELAARVLKPGCPLVVLTGQAHLPECLALMQPHMRYHWTIAYLQGGPGLTLPGFRVRPVWKPIPVFTKGKYAGKWIYDVVKGDGADKVHHPWGQSVSGFEQLVDRFTRPGDLILDPFVGGGTTAVAALKLDRRIIGADIDPEALDITRRRIEGLAGQGEPDLEERQRAGPVTRPSTS